MNKETYEQELAPLVQALLEKARNHHVPCLFALEVEGVARISGDLQGATPRLTQAFYFLLEDSEQQDIG